MEGVDLPRGLVRKKFLDQLERLVVVGKGFGLLAEQLSGELVQDDYQGEQALRVILPAFVSPSNRAVVVRLEQSLHVGVVLSFGHEPRL